MPRVRRILVIAFVPACSLLTDLGALESGDASTDATSEVASDANADAATDARDPSCPSNAIFCDDFETEPAGFVPKWDGTNFLAPDALEVTTTHAYRGAHALHVASTGSGANVFVYLSTKLGSAATIGSTLGLRAYVLAPGVEQSSAWFSLASTQVTGNVTLTHNADTSCTTDGGRCFVHYRANNAPDWIVGSAVALESATEWACVEWVVTVGDAGPENVFVENNPVTTATLDAVLAGTSGFDTLAVGYQAPSIAQELYIDDFVVTQGRAFCE
ncbi:MAG TPA: hypothetical protein VH054_22440 [Polyangiaceae bacterium]|jgi:hypothetical protein|nr:hypothetical protein [Polyangiaceae bacterium]